MDRASHPISQIPGHEDACEFEMDNRFAKRSRFFTVRSRFFTVEVA